MSREKASGRSSSLPRPERLSFSLPLSLPVVVGGLSLLLSNGCECWSWSWSLHPNLLVPSVRRSFRSTSSRSSSSAMTSAVAVPEWSDLVAETLVSPTGRALEEDAVLRKQGLGAPHVHNRVRKFPKPADASEAVSVASSPLTLYRDHAGWCPYCEKTMLLVEEKGVPINIEVVPMRSYGDKPREFTRMVPGGLLPALKVATSEGDKVITESAVIMELLDRWHPPSEGYRSMMPEAGSAEEKRYDQLFALERQLFGAWCTYLFRPEEGGGGFVGSLFGGSGGSSKDRFLDTLGKVDAALSQTKGPWFYDWSDQPTMIDFVYVSHIERMLASCAYWKGLKIRNSQFPALDAWLDAFDQRPAYLAFKSDFYTNVKDIPPQYGPAYFTTGPNNFASRLRPDADEWKLPLTHDDPLEPLYRGPPLPVCALEANGLYPDGSADSSTSTSKSTSTYEQCDQATMARACREAAAWKLASNGPAVARFAARGASIVNPDRRTFAAELADPYAEPDPSVVPAVDEALRVVCAALLRDDDTGSSVRDGMASAFPSASLPTQKKEGVTNSLAYLRDRVGVPRDMPLAAARYLRAYLNGAIDGLSAP